MCGFELRECNLDLLLFTSLMLLVKVHRVGKGGRIGKEIEGCGQVRKDVATSPVRAMNSVAQLHGGRFCNLDLEKDFTVGHNLPHTSSFTGDHRSHKDCVFGYWAVGRWVAARQATLCQPAMGADNDRSRARPGVCPAGFGGHRQLWWQLVLFGGG